MLNPPVMKRKEGARLKRNQRFLAGMVDYSVNQRDQEDQDEERHRRIEANPGSWLNKFEIEEEKYAQIDEREMEIPSDSSDEERPRTNDNLSSDVGQCEEMKDKLI